MLKVPSDGIDGAVALMVIASPLALRSAFTIVGIVCELSLLFDNPIPESTLLKIVFCTEALSVSGVTGSPAIKIPYAGETAVPLNAMIFAPDGDTFNEPILFLGSVN